MSKCLLAVCKLEKEDDRQFLIFSIYYLVVYAYLLYASSPLSWSGRTWSAGATFVLRVGHRQKRVLPASARFCHWTTLHVRRTNASNVHSLLTSTALDRVGSKSRKAGGSVFGRNKFLYETLHLSRTLPRKTSFWQKWVCNRPMAKFAQSLG